MIPTMKKKVDGIWNNNKVQSIVQQELMVNCVTLRKNSRKQSTKTVSSGVTERMKQ